MSWQNILALAVFVVVCGIIAYCGDILGRRMGKRRLSLFGLRPRYTAIVTTTITGMLIATLTIVVMAIVSQRVKLLMLQGIEIVQKYQTAKVELEEAIRERNTQRQLADRARKEADAAAKEAAVLKRTLSSLREDLDKRKAELARATRRVNELDAERNLLTRDIRRLSTDLERNKIALEATQAALAETKSKLSSARREVQVRRAEVAQLENDIQRLEKMIGQKLLEKKEKPVVFGPEQEIVRGIIECAQSKSEIKADLMALLDKADQRARAEGAQVGSNGKAIEIKPKEIRDPQARKIVSFDETSIIDFLAEEISSGSGSVVVRIYSWGNSFVGEQVIVDFWLNYNRLIYTEGAEVASTIIDGSFSRGQIFGQIIAFLRTDVRSAAIARDIIPEIDEEGQKTVGAISDWDEILDLVECIKASGKAVRVKAIAKRDIWSAGPLDVSLILSESP